MSVPVCDYCEGEITVSNARFPGYCSPGHRNAAAQARAAKRDRRRRAANDEFTAAIYRVTR